eukprot:7391867-Prymnesium_polylepis.6
MKLLVRGVEICPKDRGESTRAVFQRQARSAAAAGEMVKECTQGHVYLSAIGCLAAAVPLEGSPRQLGQTQGRTKLVGRVVLEEGLNWRAFPFEDGAPFAAMNHANNTPLV